MSSYPFTSESVTEGHPDKICDQISDAVLDAVLEQDPHGRVACETSITTGLVFVTGEISTNAVLDVPVIVRKKLRDIGYTRSEYGIDADSCGIISALNQQSPDIAAGVDRAYESRTDSTSSALDSQGAGDQGMMFGFATNETPELMPLPILLAHRLSRQLANVRRNGTVPYLRPDGKSQVTVFYDAGIPVAVDTIVLAAQHDPDVSEDQLHNDLARHVVREVIPDALRADRATVLINPTGRFVVGGPQGDAGLTGRKIIVDTYGGYARHGGGAFSGKDPTKVDRSAAYMARYVAKNIVASGAADKCEVQISYAIGVARPVSVLIDTFGTERVCSNRLELAVNELFDLRPAAIIEHLNLRRPIYGQTAAYGHFGRDEAGFTWERTDKAANLRDYLGLEHETSPLTLTTASK